MAKLGIELGNRMRWEKEASRKSVQLPLFVVNGVGGVAPSGPPVLESELWREERAVWRGGTAGRVLWAQLNSFFHCVFSRFGHIVKAQCS